LAAGLRPDPLGELERSPRPSSGNWGRGPTSKGKGEKGMGGRGKQEGKGKGRKRKGGGKWEGRLGEAKNGGRVRGGDCLLFIQLLATVL